MCSYVDVACLRSDGGLYLDTVCFLSFIIGRLQVSSKEAVSA